MPCVGRGHSCFSIPPSNQNGNAFALTTLRVTLTHLVSTCESTRLGQISVACNVIPLCYTTITNDDVGGSPDPNGCVPARDVHPLSPDVKPWYHGSMISANMCCFRHWSVLWPPLSTVVSRMPSRVVVILPWRLRSLRLSHFSCVLPWTITSALD